MGKNIEKNVAGTKKKISEILERIEGRHYFVPNRDRQVAEKRKVGEKWVDDDGYTWEQKDGYRVKSKYDLGDRGKYLESSCPKCGQYLKKHRNHVKMYKVHGMCFDCWIPIETEMRALGTYKAFEKAKIGENMKAYVREMENEMDDRISEMTTKTTFLNVVNEDITKKTGIIDMERWSALSDEQIAEIKEKYVNEIIFTRDTYREYIGEEMGDVKSGNNNVEKTSEQIVDDVAGGGTK